MHDGDTITVSYAKQDDEQTVYYSFRLRLYGIDAPEEKQPYGSQATATLASKAKGQTLKLFSKGSDKYGRVLVWAFKGSECLNKTMVTSGAAWWFEKYAPKEYRLRDEMNAARKAHRGLWAGSNPIAPWNFRKQ